MDAPTKVAPEQLTELGLTLLDQESQSVHDKIINRLRDEGVGFRYYSHQSVTTSQEAAQVRGTNLAQ